jgi:hypothetical protein
VDWQVNACGPSVGHDLMVHALLSRQSSAWQHVPAASRSMHTGHSIPGLTVTMQQSSAGSVQQVDVSVPWQTVPPRDVQSGCGVVVATPGAQTCRH